MNGYHLLDMNTSILLVESKENSITGFKSKNPAFYDHKI